MVLRIEDTDRERSTPENVEQILDALRWLEIDYDEGPISQVARSDRHQEVLQRLLDSGHAYRSTATADDVKAFKARHGADRGFRGEAQADGAVRLRVPDEGETVVHDLIRGDTTFQHVHMDDPVIARADGSVLYNFAVAVDDLDAEITHVIRGEDHLSNTPKQLLVLEAVGRRAPGLRAPPAAARPRRQEALQAPRRGLGAGAARRRLPARGGAQLHRPARVGRRGRRDADLHRRARQALPHRARLAQPGPVRRAEAALDERALHARAGDRRDHAAPGGAHRPLRACTTRSPSPRRRSRPWRTSGRWRASSSTAPPTTPRRARSGSPTAAATPWPTPARRWSAPSPSTPSTSSRPCAAWSRTAASRPRTSSSRCASRWPEPRSHRASSRPSRCSDATRRWRASTPLCGPEKLPETQVDRARASNTRPHLPIEGGSALPSTQAKALTRSL